MEQGVSIKTVVDIAGMGDIAPCDDAHERVILPDTHCRRTSYLEIGGIQPFEQPGLSNPADRRAQAGDEAGFIALAATAHERTGGQRICDAIGVEKARIFKPYRHENRRGNIKPLPTPKKAFYLSTGGKKRG